MKMHANNRRNRLIAMAALMLAIIQLNWASRLFYIVAPGVSLRLDEAVSVEGRIHGSKGLFLVTAVYTEAANPLTLLYALFDNAIDLVKGQGNKILWEPETRWELLTEMKESHAVAAQLAMRVSGRAVRCISGLQVKNVEEDSPFWGKLSVGDIVKGVDHSEVTVRGDIDMLLQRKSPGDLVRLEVIRGGRPLTFTGRLNQKSGSETFRLGAHFRASTEYRLPIEVKIDADDIRGNSGGLMFAFEILDQLLDEDLTRGRIVAGTGTLLPKGRVLQVAGVKQKVISARRWGADVFLVPKANADEAKLYSGDMVVIPVDSFYDALAKLRQMPERD